MTKELRDKYRQAEALRWGRNQKMIDYCCKRADIVFPVRGYVAGIDRPDIRTHFCFCYGYCGVSSEEEYRDAAGMADHASKSEDYFIEKNLGDLNKYIEDLEGSDYTAYASGNCTDNGSIVWINFCRGYEVEQLRFWAEKNGQVFFELTEDERKQIAGYYGIEKDRFTKRLKTYLKRYGLSKVQSWTYLSD